MSKTFYVRAYSKPSTGVAEFKELEIGDEVVPTIQSNLAASTGRGALNHVQLTLTNQNVTTTDHTTSGAQGDLQLLTFPEGLVHVLAANVNLTLARVGTNLDAAAAVVASIGTVVPAQDATLTSTEANVVPSTACTLSSGAGSFKGSSTGSATLDGTAAAASLYLNFAVPDAGSAGNDALTVNGTIDLWFLFAGDH